MWETWSTEEAAVDWGALSHGSAAPPGQKPTRWDAWAPGEEPSRGGLLFLSPSSPLSPVILVGQPMGALHFPRMGQPRDPDKPMTMFLASKYSQSEAFPGSFYSDTDGPSGSRTGPWGPMG